VPRLTTVTPRDVNHHTRYVPSVPNNSCNQYNTLGSTKHKTQYYTNTVQQETTTIISNQQTDSSHTIKNRKSQIAITIIPVKYNPIPTIKDLSQQSRIYPNNQGSIPLLTPKCEVLLLDMLWA